MSFTADFSNLSTAEIMRILRADNYPDIVMHLCEKVENLEWDLEEALQEADYAREELEGTFDTDELQDELYHTVYELKELKAKYEYLKNRANVWHILSDQDDRIVKD